MEFLIPQVAPCLSFVSSALQSFEGIFVRLSKSEYLQILYVGGLLVLLKAKLMLNDSIA